VTGTTSRLWRGAPEIDFHTGDGTLYDGRLLHSGQPNTEGTRVLFYVTFKALDADGDLGNEDAHSIDPELFGRGLTLASFLDGP